MATKKAGTKSGAKSGAKAKRGRSLEIKDLKGRPEKLSEVRGGRRSKGGTLTCGYCGTG